MDLGGLGGGGWSWVELSARFSNTHFLTTESVDELGKNLKNGTKNQ